MRYYVYKIEYVTAVNEEGKGEKCPVTKRSYLKHFEKLKQERGGSFLWYRIETSTNKTGQVDVILKDNSYKVIKYLGIVTSFEDTDEITVMKNTIAVDQLNPGECFEFGEIEWVKLDTAYNGCLCLAKDVLFSSWFDDNRKTNWSATSLRQIVHKKFTGKFDDEDVLLPFNRDLTTDDGMIKYGNCTDTISLLTCEEYRKYRKVIPNCGKCW